MKSRNNVVYILFRALVLSVDEKRCVLAWTEALHLGIRERFQMRSAEADILMSSTLWGSSDSEVGGGS